MYWIVFTVLIGVGDDKADFSVQVPDFAEGMQFEDLRSCNEFLTQGFISGQLPDISKSWNLTAELARVSAQNHNVISRGSFINYQVACVGNEL